MKKSESSLRNAERFVRAVFEEDFKQKVDDETLQRAILRASLGSHGRTRGVTQPKTTRRRIPEQAAAD